MVLCPDFLRCSGLAATDCRWARHAIVVRVLDQIETDPYILFLVFALGQGENEKRFERKERSAESQKSIFKWIAYVLVIERSVQAPQSRWWPCSSAASTHQDPRLSAQTERRKEDTPTARQSGHSPRSQVRSQSETRGRG